MFCFLGLSKMSFDSLVVLSCDLFLLEPSSFSVESSRSLLMSSGLVLGFYLAFGHSLGLFLLSCHLFDNALIKGEIERSS